MKRRRPPSYIEPRQILTIVLLLVCLVAVLVLKSRCGAAAGNLFRAVDSPGAADGGAPRG
ncbi:MAG TPA: hypothetical protein VII38_13225 [Polyangia bacterium]|jgi:hypothetical protein